LDTWRKKGGIDDLGKLRSGEKRNGAILTTSWRKFYFSKVRFLILGFSEFYDCTNFLNSKNGF